MMFRHLDAPIEYRQPWNIDYSTRRQSLAQSDMHVAYVYELEDTSTFRYRVFNMVETLLANPSQGASAGWFTRNDFHHDLSFVDAADVLVISRTRYDEGVARLVERARGRGTLVLFDIDDLIFDPRLVHLVMHTLDVNPMSEPSWDHWYAYIGRLSATLDLCDGVLVTTNYLEEQIRRFKPSMPTAVVPNFLNRRQAEVSAHLEAKKKATGFSRDDRVIVGYFSGSPSHNKDLLIASPALATSMASHRDLWLRVVGYIELNDHLLPYADRIELVPFQDFLNLQRVTAQCEFSIAPLQLNSFTQCKSELKYFEAAAVGCPTIASPTPAFRSSIREGENGTIAEVHEWRDKIELLYESAGRLDDRYLEMVDSMLVDSHERYGWDLQAPRILAAIEAVQAQRSTGAASDRLATGDRLPI